MTRAAILSFAHPHAVSYVRALQARDDVELVVADPDGAGAPDAAPRGRVLADELGVVYADSYEEALAGVDAAIVTAENARHRGLAERAAAAGAHILCEKPLATTLEDGRAMLEATRRAGVGLMVAYPVRFSAAFTDLRDRVQRGELGEVLGIRGTNNGKLPAGRSWFTGPVLAGGGALVDHVVHCADLIDDLLGREAETVRAVANRILHADQGIDVETGGLVTIRYPGGVVATIDCSWSYPGAAATWGSLTLQVLGSRGTATIAPFAQHLDGYTSEGLVHTPVGDDLDAAMLDAFLASVRGERDWTPDGDTGYRTLQIVDAAQHSTRDGGPVSIS